MASSHMHDYQIHRFASSEVLVFFVIDSNCVIVIITTYLQLVIVNVMIQLESMELTLSDG